MVNKGQSHKHIRDVTKYVLKPLNPSHRFSVIAYRLFIHFLEDKYGLEFPQLLRELKVGRSGVDLCVPSEDEVAESLRLLKEMQEAGVFRRRNYLQLYLLLLASGIRLSEARRFLASLPQNYKETGGVRVYALNWQRGSKAGFYVFTPAWLELRRENVNWETHGPHRKIPVTPRYVRKFVATKMYELDIPAEVIDFIQGRTPRSVLTQHYLNLLLKATREYSKYADWLRNFLAKLEEKDKRGHEGV
ncbi:MAG: integrase [Candidatus Freyarchaeota archaeon]